MVREKKIKPGERVKVAFSTRERELLEKHTFADPEYAERLQPAEKATGFIGWYALDDLDDMLGYIAAEANHTKDRTLRRALDNLYERLAREMESYDDGEWQSAL